MRGSGRSLGHQPVLDGVRGAAWAAVFVSHTPYAPSDVAIGQVAMFVFFGLSGFLITSLLVEERSRHGRISLRDFYVRRALRLGPALVVFLILWLAVVALLGNQHWMTTVPGLHGPGGGEPFSVALEGVGAGLAYLTNWFDIFNVFGGYVPLGHLWSLAVEEQFYLLWAPILALLLCWGRRLAVWGASLLAVASLLDVVWIQHAHSTTSWVFRGTDTRAATFLIGGALGLVWAGSRAPSLRWRRCCSPVAWACLGVMVWSGWVFAHRATAVSYGLAWITISVAAPLAVVCLIDRTPRSSILGTAALTYLGRRSYALYLWHYVWLTWFRDLGLAGVVGALAASLVCAELSWRLVEAPALRLKRRFEHRPETVERQPPARDVLVGMTGLGVPALAGRRRSSPPDGASAGHCYAVSGVGGGGTCRPGTS